MRLPSLSHVLPGLLLLALAGCGGHDSAGPREPLPTLTVQVATAELAPMTRAQPLPGTVHPVDQADVAAKIMATVQETPFTIGQSVKAGQVLVRLQADELKARGEQAEAALAQVQRNFERERALLEQGATTAETVRTLEDELRLARARLDEARTMLTYTEVEAPFDGLITAKNVRRGDLASPGMPLLSIEGPDSLRVHVQVPDSLTALERGTEISIEANGQTLTGSLAEWSPAADPASRTRLAKIDLPADAQLRSGQYVRVEWPAATIEALWVPRAALSPTGQMQRIFTVRDGHARLCLVRTGRETAEAVQVLSGLEPGETLILAPAPELRDGQPVEIKN